MAADLNLLVADYDFRSNDIQLIANCKSKNVIMRQYETLRDPLSCLKKD